MARQAKWVIVGDGYCIEVTLEGETMMLVHRCRDNGQQTLVMSGLRAVQDAWLVLGEAVHHLSRNATRSAATSRAQETPTQVRRRRG